MVCVSVCVSERERERERAVRMILNVCMYIKKKTQYTVNFFPDYSV